MGLLAGGFAALGALVPAAASETAPVTVTSIEVHGSSSLATAEGWPLVLLWSYTDAGWRACNIDGQSRADGSTGYYCAATEWNGATWWGEYVGGG